MSIKRRRGGQSSEWLRKVNQEDLLAEIAERLQLELNKADMTVEAFSEKLGRPAVHVEALLEGLVNISVRDLADTFSVFNKIVALNLIEQGSSAKVVRQRKVAPQINSDRPLLAMSIEFKFKDSPVITHAYDFQFIDIISTSSLKGSVDEREGFLIDSHTNVLLNSDLNQTWRVPHEF